MNNELTDFILYTTDTGDVRLEVFLQDETVWLTQSKIAQLFMVGIPAISKHLKHIFDEGELQETAVVSIMETTATDGKSYKTTYYNLDAIIAVGYRVNSRRATQFRIWASKVIKEYIVKGFALDDKRLKQAQTVFGDDYFKELLQRIRSIRTSERRIYLQITDIFAECSIDYNPHSDTTKKFFATVQNKFHYAITGQTAAEIVFQLADAKKPNMGLTTWQNSPDGRILKADVNIAKNYLSETDVKKLDRTVSSFFDYIEGVIERKNAFTMGQFAESVNKFLTFNEYDLLDSNGSVSYTIAIKKAEQEYDAFNKAQPINSDFVKYLREQGATED